MCVCFGGWGRQREEAVEHRKEERASLYEEGAVRLGRIESWP